MPAAELTDMSVRNWPPADKRQEIADTKENGLYLLVQPSGAKSWAVRYRFGGRLAKWTIGPYPRWSLKAAREKTREAQQLRTDPIDPKDPRAVQKEARRRARDERNSQQDLFRSVAERYLREYALSRRNRNYSEKARLLGLRTDPQDKNKWQIIKGRSVDLWDKKLIQDISRRDVREHLQKLAETAPIGANRAFSELRTFFNWCVSKDLLLVSPMQGLAPPSKENDSRVRALLRRSEIPGSTDDELRWLWRACEQYDQPELDEGRKGHGRKHRGPFGPFVQLLILTGQRRNEVAAMTWAEIDQKKRTWTIPGSRVKNGIAHLVPLSDAALTILAELARISGSKGYVFTTDGEHPISGFSRMKKRIDKLMAQAAAKERSGAVNIPEWRLHDLRRTLAVGMQRLGVKLEVTEKVLNHTSGTFAGIVGVYNVYDYAKEKRAALRKWEQFVTKLVGAKPSDNVGPQSS